MYYSLGPNKTSWTKKEISMQRTTRRKKLQNTLNILRLIENPYKELIQGLLSMSMAKLN